MAQVTTPDMAMRMVEANTIHPPHCKCGTKRRISTRKANNVINKVGSSSIRRPSKYRAECEGE